MKTMLKKALRARRLCFEPLEERTLLSANPDVLVRFDGWLVDGFYGRGVEQFSYSGGSYEIDHAFDNGMGRSVITGSLSTNSRSTGMLSDEYIFSTRWYASNHANSVPRGTLGGNGVIGSIAVWVRGEADTPYHLEVNINGSAVGSCNYVGNHFACGASAQTWRGEDGDGGGVSYNQSGTLPYHFVTDWGICTFQERIKR